MQKFSKVLTLMVAMLALAFCAMSCKVNVDGNPTKYTVTVESSIEHGKVSVDKTSAEAETTITLTATADEGYELDSYSVKDESSNDITVTDDTFVMPKSNVTVSATFKKTEATLNQEAADPVITKINAIGEVTYTDDCKAKIDEARTAYNALTDAQKALIPAETLAVLTKAETDYNALKTSADEAAANQAAADAVIAKINAIGTVAYTTESKTKIDDARTAYDELTDAQKALVTNYSTLTTAEATYESLIPTYKVTLTGGANATISGGEATQEGLSGAMTTVTYTAHDGCHFADFSDITSNGITATRTSDKVVTVSGTPTADTSITIPDAAKGWVYSEVKSYTLGSEYGGLKITGSQKRSGSGNFYSDSYTFSNTEGKKFKKIEMLSTATDFSGTGVSTESYSFYSTQDRRDVNGKKITWTGSAEEVTMNGYAYAVEYILVEYDE